MKLSIWMLVRCMLVLLNTGILRKEISDAMDFSQIMFIPNNADKYGCHIIANILNIIM